MGELYWVSGPCTPSQTPRDAWAPRCTPPSQSGGILQPPAHEGSSRRRWNRWRIYKKETQIPWVGLWNKHSGNCGNCAKPKISFSMGSSPPTRKRLHKNDNCVSKCSNPRVNKQISSQRLWQKITKRGFGPMSPNLFWRQTSFNDSRLSSVIGLFCCALDRHQDVKNSLAMAACWVWVYSKITPK